jgi:AAA15 family ATPase/GTPase
MLVRFRVSNFLSFREDAEFNLLTGSPRRFEHHVYETAGLEILKMAGIYGANGAGKSNLVKSILYLREMVVTGWVSPAILQFKLNAEKDKRPSTFEIEFVSEGVVYLYGMDVNARHIEEEWLYKSGISKEDELIFHRYTKDGKTQINYHTGLFKTEEDKFRMKLYETEILSETTSLLGILGKSKIALSEIKAAFNWFDKYLNLIRPETKFKGVIYDLVRNPAFFRFVNDMMCSFQTGISQIVLKTHSLDEFFGKDSSIDIERFRGDLESKGPNGVVFIESSGIKEEIIMMYENGQPVVKRVIYLHQDKAGNEVPFDLWQESDGTRRLFELAPGIFKAVYTPALVLIDEIEHSIHPTLLREIVSKFANTTDTRGQLVFTTHETYLLDQDYMRQDEFWFAEKDEQGATTFAPLSDYKIRYDLDLRKGYLSGRFGAVPAMGPLKRVKWEGYAEAK